MDNIIWFEHLSKDVISLVVEKFIAELQAQLDARGVSMEVSKEAKAWLAEKGYDKAMGARPMARVIQENLKKNQWQMNYCLVIWLMAVRYE